MIKKPLLYSLAFAVLLMAAVALARYAEAQHWVGADGARRTLQVFIGLALAAYGNAMPKQIGRWRGSTVAASRSQAALRVAGWSMTLAGLAHAGLWAFAPLTVADTGSLIAVGAATAVTLGYAVWCFTLCRRAPRAEGGV